MKFMSIDIETYSDIDINKAGVYRYVDTDAFKILLFAYSVDGGPVQLIDLTRGDSIPKEIVKALSDKSVTKWAYNANFERVALSRFLGMPTGQYLDPEGWKCSMVWAATLGLPMGLAKVGEVLALDKQKMSEGRGLIYKFCKPDKKTGQRVMPEEFPEDWETFRRYNIRDVETEMGIQKMISPFPCSDELWQEYWTDQRINDRGVEVDLTLAKNAVAMDAEISENLMEKMRSLTGIDNPRSTSQLDMWLREHGCDMVSLGKKDVAQVIEETDDPLIRKVLSLRLLIAKSSVKKYTKMLDATCSDGRARGMFQFYGAMRTGRFAGRLLQLQNLPQNHIENIELVRELARRGDLEALSVMFDSVPDILSQLIRTAFVAREGSRFIVADFSAIEARVIAWLAGEEWRMQAFAEGKDIYCASASAMFGVPVVKHGINGELRQKGKVAELACGYGGSVGALKAFGADKMGLTETEMQSIVDNWRASSPRIVQLWWNVDRAIKQTLEDGTTHRTHGLMFSLQKGILFIRLPSGRSLVYVKPRLIDGKITYEGVSSNKGWARLESYGPKFVENCLAEGTQVLTDRGWIEIQNVTTKDALWDGEQWVSHEGLINKGIQEVINIDGALMTPDHKVLTQEGWKNAPSCKGLKRYEVKQPNSDRVRRVEREEIPVEGKMRLWERVHHDCRAFFRRKAEILRLLERKANKHCKRNPQALQTPFIPCLAFNEGTLHGSYSSSLGQLWRQGNQSLRQMARIIREFLGGYVTNLPERANAGQNRREWELHSRELQMGGLQNPVQKQTSKYTDRYTLGQDNCERGCRSFRNRGHNAPLQNTAWLDDRYLVRKTGLKKQVYDLKNAGPNHRFTIKTEAGPMIVHNCVQAISRDLLLNAMKQVGPDARICMHIHDELVIEADDSVKLDDVCKKMALVPEWAEGLLLRADGYETKFYLKD
jgi:DNA polymerase